MSLPLSVYSLSLSVTCSSIHFPPTHRFISFCPTSRPSVGGSGGDPAWRGEGSDVQGVLAVGVCGQSSDAAGSPVGSP